jgi:hypothetical protein
MPKKTDVSPMNNEILSQIPKISPVQDVFGWTVPVEQVPLPSNGMIYSKENPLHNCETLQIKAMTAQEEDILLSRALVKEGTVVTHLIKSCLIDKSIEVRDLLLGDRNSLLVAIRITGYGTDYTAAASCPSCGKEDTQVFDLSKIEIKRLGTSPVVPGTNEFSFTLPVSKKVVTFKLLTVRDEEETSKTREKMAKLFPDAKVEGVVTRQLENQILSIDGQRDKTAISAFIKVMPALDSRSLRNHMLGIEPGLDMRVDFSCKYCGAESKVALPAGASFFWIGA